MKSYDVAVIGGGPAGLMAAGRAAELGARVILLEKNPTLGRKLLLTGGGRCNLTNAGTEGRDFLAKYGNGAKFLFSPFAQFGVKETLEFFNVRHVPTKVEAGGRVFPVSDQAQSVLDALVNYLTLGGVQVRIGAAVKSLEIENKEISKIVLADGQAILAKNYIIAAGGKSHPETGSTGDGFSWLKKAGHTIIEPNASLVPVRVGETWIRDLQGISLTEAKLSLFSYGKKIVAKKGKMLFTHFGLSGPLVLNMSNLIGKTLEEGDAVLELDLLPAFDYAALNARLQELFANNKNKKLKNVLGELIQAALVNVLGQISPINFDKEINAVTREERTSLIKLLKHLPLTPTGLLGEDQAIVTSGGVKLEEIDWKTMRSKHLHNLFLVGDILDIDRPSGGYSLQLCWTTGYVAGTAGQQVSSQLS